MQQLQQLQQLAVRRDPRVSSDITLLLWSSLSVVVVVCCMLYVVCGCLVVGLVGLVGLVDLVDLVVVAVVGCCTLLPYFP